MLGAILTQNTAWKNVERALENLKREDLISIEKLASIPLHSLANLIRPSGYFNQKAVKIKNLVRFIIEDYGGDIRRMFEEDKEKLREELLGIKGIGPETADSIMLYAGNKPVFVVDSYTYRVLSRHGLIPEEASYGEIQELFMDSLPE
ncbi:MAG: endonuclease III domain-containing protein, partial [Candidatus Bathyarchaeia archaeon]